MAKDTEQRQWKRPLILVALCAFFFVLGVCVAPALITADLDNWGAWVRDFAKSPGIAVVAALIALIGILRQVAVSRDSLEHQRETATASSWWKSFEWASSRALPGREGDIPLPNEVTISTLQSLSSSAVTDVQRVACSGLIDALAVQVVVEAPTVSSAEPAASDRSANRAAFRALVSYVDANNGTAAASPAAEAAVRDYEKYRDSVLAAVKSLGPEIRVFREPDISNSKADAVVEVRGVRVALEVSFARTSSVTRARFYAAAQLRQDVSADPLVLVSRFASPFSSDEESRHRVVIAQWNDPNDNDRLSKALRRASHL